MSRPAPSVEEVVMHPDNELLYPLSEMGSEGWAAKDVDEIRDALASKPGLHYPLGDQGEHLRRKSVGGVSVRMRKMSVHRAERGEAKNKHKRNGAAPVDHALNGSAAE